MLARNWLKTEFEKIGVESGRTGGDAMRVRFETYRQPVGPRVPREVDVVNVEAVLPGSLQFVSATPSQGSCSNGPGGLVCQFDPIPPGQQASVILVTHPTVLGSITLDGANGENALKIAAKLTGRSLPVEAAPAR